ncbi:MAG: Gfo/Idh/MocA family oxidoreductase [bacterium]|nr:Gfo/Idh/MocA family oxidoreductase [bacterium]
MIRVGIVGCGKIADQHAACIERIAEAEITSVCDSEYLMARQLGERFGVPGIYNVLDEMLNKDAPDVVHITTPPLSHFDIASSCLRAGASVYVEKPFALTAPETEKLIKMAEEKGLKVTAGHNLQFSHAAMRARDIIKKGLIGEAVHMESYYCYDLGDPRYAKAVLGDENHWVRKLPGRLMHNLISHGVSKVAEYVQGDDPEVVAVGFTSKALLSVGEEDIIDEVRVIINDGNRFTAQFTFSTQMKPTMRHMRIYGTRNAITVDDDSQMVVLVRGGRYKSFLEQFLPPFYYSGQYMKSFIFNTWKFLRNDFHGDHGMKYLMEKFYRSISGDDPVPIPYREISITARIMDDIFKQVYGTAKKLS